MWLRDVPRNEREEAPGNVLLDGDLVVGIEYPTGGATFEYDGAGLRVLKFPEITWTRNGSAWLSSHGETFDGKFRIHAGPFRKNTIGAVEKIGRTGRTIEIVRPEGTRILHGRLDGMVAVMHVIEGTRAIYMSPCGNETPIQDEAALARFVQNT